MKLLRCSRGFTPFIPGAPQGFELKFELADAPDGAPNGSEFFGTHRTPTRGRAEKNSKREDPSKGYLKVG